MRVVTGFYLGLDHPSILRAEVCVAQSVFGKGTWLAERGISSMAGVRPSASRSCG
jgi:putative transposase